MSAEKPTSSSASKGGFLGGAGDGRYVKSLAEISKKPAAGSEKRGKFNVEEVNMGSATTSSTAASAKSTAANAPPLPQLDSLKSRLSAFLPQLAASNQALQAKQAGSSADLESRLKDSIVQLIEKKDEDSSDDEVQAGQVEMSLGLLASDGHLLNLSAEEEDEDGC